MWPRLPPRALAVPSKSSPALIPKWSSPAFPWAAPISLKPLVLAPRPRTPPLPISLWASPRLSKLSRPAAPLRIIPWTPSPPPPLPPIPWPAPSIRSPILWKPSSSPKAAVMKSFCPKSPNPALWALLPRALPVPSGWTPPLMRKARSSTFPWATMNSMKHPPSAAWPRILNS